MSSSAMRASSASPLCCRQHSRLPRPFAQLVALIKPQFEVGKEVGKGGVVRDPALHREVCARITAWLDAQPRWRVGGLTESPLRGPDGNVEFLVYARRTPPLEARRERRR